MTDDYSSDEPIIKLHKMIRDLLIDNCFRAKQSPESDIPLEISLTLERVQRDIAYYKQVMMMQADTINHLTNKLMSSVK